jgi:twitching motility protein PilJ
MDEVAGGKLDAALPDTNSDRLTQAFQKLLGKVAESIHAKRDLTELRAALARLSEQLAPVRRGNLDLEIKPEAPEAFEIADTLNYLIGQMGETILELKTGGDRMRSAALAAQETVREVVCKNENRASEMTHAAAVLRQAPAIIQQISEELSQSAKAATQSIEKARRGGAAAQENLKTAGILRRQAQEAAKRIERLRERSQELSRFGKTIDDLAHRASMLALNASVQASESCGEAGAGRAFVVVSEEIERLAERASQTSKNIASLNQTLRSEIGEAENALGAAVSEAANLSRSAIETGGALGELEKYVAGVLSLQDKIAAASRERGEEAERAFQVFAEAIDEAESELARLKDSIESTRRIAAAVESLQSLAADFKVSKSAPETVFQFPSSSSSSSSAPAAPEKDSSLPPLTIYVAPIPASLPSDVDDFSYYFLGD